MITLFAFFVGCLFGFCVGLSMAVFVVEMERYDVLKAPPDKEEL